MNSLFTVFNRMNGWKSVIAVILSVGSAYLGIKDELTTNKTQMTAFINYQSKVDERQDKQFDVLQQMIHDDLQHLGDKIDERNRAAGVK